MDVGKSELSTSDTKTKMLEQEVRALLHGDRSAKAAKRASETCDDFLAVGATSIEDIENLMGELLTARDYLQSEGERVRRVNARHAHLAQTASALVKLITERMGKWRNMETESQAPAALPRAPTPALVHDGELQHQSDDQ